MAPKSCSNLVMQIEEEVPLANFDSDTKSNLYSKKSKGYKTFELATKHERKQSSVEKHKGDLSTSGYQLSPSKTKSIPEPALSKHISHPSKLASLKNSRSLIPTTCDDGDRKNQRCETHSEGSEVRVKRSQLERRLSSPKSQRKSSSIKECRSPSSTKLRSKLHHHSSTVCQKNPSSNAGSSVESSSNGSGIKSTDAPQPPESLCRGTSTESREAPSCSSTSSATSKSDESTKTAESQRIILEQEKTIRTLRKKVNAQKKSSRADLEQVSEGQMRIKKLEKQIQDLTALSALGNGWKTKAAELESKLASMENERLESDQRNEAQKERIDGIKKSEGGMVNLLVHPSPPPSPFNEKLTRLKSDCMARESKLRTQLFDSHHSVQSQMADLEQAQRRIIQLELELEDALRHQDRVAGNSDTVEEKNPSTASIAASESNPSVEQEELRKYIAENDSLKEQLKKCQERCVELEESERSTRQDLQSFKEETNHAFFELMGSQLKMSALQQERKGLGKDCDDGEAQEHARTIPDVSSDATESSDLPFVPILDTFSCGSKHDGSTFSRLVEENVKLKEALVNLQARHDEECSKLRKQIDWLSDELFFA